MPPDAGSPVDVNVEMPPMPAGAQTDPQHPSRDAAIPKVRAQLRRRGGGELFTPHSVPIGPYHGHGDAGSWLWTQEKKQAVQDLVQCGVNLSDLTLAVEGIESKARGYYTHLGDAMDSEKFCSMLLLDGCYLLSFFIDYQYPEPTGGAAIANGSRRRMASRDNTVVRDILYLLENQVPLFVIDEIFKLLEAQTSALLCIARAVEQLLQRQLYISKTPRMAPSSSSHLLDLVHYYMAPQQPTRMTLREAVDGNTDPSETQLYRWWTSSQHLWELLYSYLPLQKQQQQQEEEEPMSTCTGRWHRATEYRRNGDLTFKPRSFAAGDEWTILAVQLDGRSLLIPLLRIDSHTWTLLRNLMALEEHRDARPVTAYCLFMSQLACTVEDVELLRSAKVIESFLGSDASTAQGFADLCHGVALDIDNVDQNYLKPMWHHMGKRCSLRAHNFKGVFREKYCSNVFYIFVFCIAFVLSACQVLQCIYAIIAYHKPK
ncbi:unnamed protein product [Alopecurus aequalis]